MTPSALSHKVNRPARRLGRMSSALFAAITIAALLSVLGPASAHAETFAFKSFSVRLSEEDGSPAVRAGSHPFAFTTHYELKSHVNEFEEPQIDGGLPKHVGVDLPAGIVINPTATPTRCTEGLLVSESCPLSSAVGVVTANIIGLGNYKTGLYNMVTLPGTPGVLAFNPLASAVVHLVGRVRSNGDYGISADVNEITQKASVSGASVEIWGDPASPAHDSARGPCALPAAQENGSICPIERCFVAAEGNECREQGIFDPAFLTLPSRCSGPLDASITANTWEEPNLFTAAATTTTDSAGEPTGIEECSRLPFSPSVAVQPETTISESPTGLAVDVHIPQDPNARDLATANLKDAVVTLPEGMSVNPSSANGLAGCSTTQIGYEGVKEGRLAFSAAPAQCPDASKLGTVEVDTPLLDHPLPGSVYLAAQNDNPFHSLLAIYIAVADPQTGVVIKLPGHVVPNPTTGQLTATFEENPQLPFEDFKLHFFGGPGASLTTPPTCGTKTTTSQLTPWSAPQSGPPATPFDSFVVSHGPGGAPCAASEAGLPNKPAFEAGTTVPIAGSYSPFVLKVSREDGSQHLTSIDTTLPEGLVGRLAGVPYCSDAAIAAAAGKTGSAEQLTPSCPAASQVGNVNVGAGAGSSPLYVQGHAYLAGPYKGAPLSLAIITPAVAGPFDLGTVVVRTALYVDPFSAQIHAVSDPIPTIMQGIPLDVRSIALNMNRPKFTLNPTSCDPMAVLGSATTIPGQSANLSDRFQVGACGALGFKPKLAISLKGRTTRGGHPALKAVLTYPKQGAYANIARAQVGLPHSEFLDQANIGTVCTQPQLKSQSCPKASIYGHAKAWTPLLDKPLEGPVYLGVGFGHKLPDLVAELDGQLRVLLHGKVDTDSEDGIRNTFEAVPDAPVTKFVLEMQGGAKKGLLRNSENICAKPQRATVHLTAHNGKVSDSTPLIANSCGGKAKGKKRGGK